MRLKIDCASAKLFDACADDQATPPQSRRRSYCAQEPYRVILICSNALSLDDLAGAVVDVSIGEVQGTAGLVREPNVGLPHTQIMVHGRLPDALSEKMLAQVLVDSKRDRGRWARPGGVG